MSPIPEQLRLANRERAAGRCEYCLVHEADVIVPHQPDHIVAVQHGGQSAAENLALACCDCNLFKGPNLASIDPLTGHAALLFNPRRDRWPDHFRLDGGHIAGLTPAGHATAFLLQFNTLERVRLRELLHRAGRYSGIQ